MEDDPFGSGYVTTTLINYVAINSEEELVTLDVSLEMNISESNKYSQTNQTYTPYNLRPETYLVPFIFSLIFICGIIGNSTLIRIFIQHQSMRTPPNTFILSLAAGDILVMIGSLPFISLIYTLESWPFGLFICKMSEFLRDLSMGVTVLTLTMLAIDRYWAIKSPICIANDPVNRRTTMFMILIAWTVSFIIATPGAYFSYLMILKINDSKSVEICYPFPQEFGIIYPRVMTAVKFCVIYLIPLLIIGTFYSLMAKNLLHLTENMPASSTKYTKRQEMRSKVAKMVLALIIIFAISFLPNHIFVIWFYFTYPDSMRNYNAFWHYLKIIGYVLTYANSCLNPIILCLLSRRFRSMFKKYLYCWPLIKKSKYKPKVRLERKPKLRVLNHEKRVFSFQVIQASKSSNTTNTSKML